MNSPDVAAALYAGAPDAAGQLYDAHAEALFQYGWLTLRNRQHAQAAVCDALVQAGLQHAAAPRLGTAEGAAVGGSFAIVLRTVSIVER